jgi:uncharacterized protein (TIGR03437 family)
VTVTYQGQTTVPFSIRSAPAVPAVFTQDFSGFGQAVARNEDGSNNTQANPAKAGEVISLFATGLGRSGSPVTVS